MYDALGDVSIWCRYSVPILISYALNEILDISHSPPPLHSYLPRELQRPISPTCFLFYFVFTLVGFYTGFPLHLSEDAFKARTIRKVLYRSVFILIDIIRDSNGESRSVGTNDDRSCELLKTCFIQIKNKAGDFQ